MLEMGVGFDTTITSKETLLSRSRFIGRVVIDIKYNSNKVRHQTAMACSSERKKRKTVKGEDQRSIAHRWPLIV
jgi:hypothetical protein